MSKKERLEIRRQIFHLLLGALIVFSYQLRIINIDILFMVFIVGFIISLISLKHKIPIIYWFLKKFEREEDLKKSPGRGVLTYIAGILVVLILFNEDIALASVMILAVGDSISHMVGKYFGKRRYSLNNPKHIEGTIFGIFLATISASLFVGFLLAFLGSLAAMITEAVNLRVKDTIIDDNLIIPIIAASVMYLIQIF